VFTYIWHIVEVGYETRCKHIRHYKIVKCICIQHFIMGYNQCIGADRVNDFQTIQAICSQHHINISDSSVVKCDSLEISSTKIRRAISEGNVSLAAKMLGRQYFMSGTVIKGKEIGRTINFPTANINVDATKALPLAGVYAVQAEVAGKRYDGMLNIGNNPTISNDAPQTIEVHLFDFQQDIYGVQICVHFIERMRDEQKFSSMQELQAALTIDKAKARRILSFHQSQYPNHEDKHYNGGLQTQ